MLGPSLLAKDNFTSFSKSTLASNNIDFTVIADVYTVEVDKTEDALPIIDLVRDNIESFEVIKGTMDDAFIGITGKEIRK